MITIEMEPLVGLAPTNTSFKTAPVAAGAQGQKWRSHVDLHHEPPPSQSGVQI